MEDFLNEIHCATDVINSWRAIMKRIDEIEQTGMSIREQLECPELTKLDLELRGLESCFLGALMGLVDALHEIGFVNMLQEFK